MIKLNPAKLKPIDLARLLAKAGRVRITKKQIDADLKLGAPHNANGTLHLVRYTAWLVTTTRNKVGDRAASSQHRSPKHQH